MDVRTGEVHRFENGEDLFSEQMRRAREGEAQLVELRNLARVGCYKCLGSGNQGKNIKTGLYRVCSCTQETDEEREAMESCETPR